MGRVVSLEEARALRAQLRRDGQRLAVANGHFDLLHVGHLRYLRDARKEADRLLVLINADDSVERLKGAGRPLVPQDERAELLAALDPVDWVVIFDGDSPARVLADLQPEVHCKGTDYGTPEAVPEFEVVKAYGGRTALVGDPKDHSTRDLIAAARSLE